MTQEPVQPVAEEAKTPSKDLTDKVGALRALTTTVKLLQEGMFPFSHRVAIEQSINFLSNLHGSLAEEALAHPDADLIPELAAFKQFINKGE